MKCRNNGIVDSNLQSMKPSEHIFSTFFFFYGILFIWQFFLGYWHTETKNLRLQEYSQNKNSTAKHQVTTVSHSLSRPCHGLSYFGTVHTSGYITVAQTGLQQTLCPEVSFTCLLSSNPILKLYPLNIAQYVFDPLFAKRPTHVQ